MDVTNIPLKEIDYFDRLFYLRHKTESDLSPQDVDTVFNPIWVQKKQSKQYRIIDGFLLTTLMSQHKNIEQIPARIFSDTHSPVDLWVLRIRKRLVENNLMPIALLESLTSLLSHLDIQEPPVEINPIVRQLGISTNECNMKDLSQTLATLTNHCGFCDLSALTYRELFSLSRRSKQELKAFSLLFQEMQLKGNKLQSLLQIVDDLAKGYNLPSEVIAARQEVKAIHTTCPSHLKYKTLKAFLTSLRWPILDDTRKKWQQVIKQLSLPGRLDISTDPWFESNQIEFSLKASSLTEFQELLSQLDRMAKSDPFASLFDFI